MNTIQKSYFQLLLVILLLQGTSPRTVADPGHHVGVHRAGGHAKGEEEIVGGIRRDIDEDDDGGDVSDNHRTNASATSAATGETGPTGY